MNARRVCGEAGGVRDLVGLSAHEKSIRRLVLATDSMLSTGTPTAVPFEVMPRNPSMRL